MFYYLIAAALAAHTVFWGAGLSWLVLPRVWRRWWWALAPGLGIALQSAVVWAGAHTSLAGTNRYAIWSELLPLGLGLVAAWRLGWRAPRTRWRGAGGLLLLSVVAGWILLWPMAQRGGWTLTSSSLGSCDHADYAAGARVFQEFSKDDRTGFLGLAEVTRVGTTENFFEYWVRLNHFTPSALLAHNGSVFALESHQLVSVTGVVLVLLNSALVMLLGRTLFGLRGVTALAPAALYLFSPLGAYAVHHAALGQLYGAQGIALLTLAVFGAGRGVRTGQSPWAWAPLVLAACWILAGSYNFILTVALAPAGAWLVAEACRRRDWRGPARVLGMVLGMLAVCVVLFWARFDGLAERFRLMEQYNFGWPVPLLSPEGWLGLVRDTGLQAWPFAVRCTLSVLVIGGWLAGVFLTWRQRADRGLAALALTLPVIAGWGLLVWEARLRANASYDAYKLLAVFHPGLVAGLTCWLALPARAAGRRIALGLVLLVLAANGRVAWQFARQMAEPPLRVDRRLLDLRRLETMPRLNSFNIRIEDFWSRLWANAFLLRKPQYFVTHSYEGRLDTPLLGEWDLSDSLLRSHTVRKEDQVAINDQFHAVRAGAPGRVELAFGPGWYAPEGSGPNRWRWSSGPAGILVSNSSPASQAVTITLRVRPLGRTRLHLELDGVRLDAPRPLDDTIQLVEYHGIILPPGTSTLMLRPDDPPGHAGAGDPRPLAIALYGLTMRTVP